MILSGLPGVGKTTIARLVCRRIAALHLRIDTIEQALAAAQGMDVGVGPEGYLVAYRVAADNLQLGTSVVADAVNPVDITRQAWRDVASAAWVRGLDVEIVCSDKSEHRRRVEGRRPDIPGHELPRWEAVCGREYEPWTADRLVIDTAFHTPEDSTARILDALAEAGLRATGRERT